MAAVLRLVATKLRLLREQQGRECGGDGVHAAHTRGPNGHAQVQPGTTPLCIMCVLRRRAVLA
eukprot:102967-Rhodomonas_salina.3